MKESVADFTAIPGRGMYDGSALGKSLLTERLFGETMSRMTDVITFRAPTGQAKATLEGIAATQDESVSTFIRTAIAERVKRLNDEWVPTGNPAIDRTKIQ